MTENKTTIEHIQEILTQVKSENIGAIDLASHLSQLYSEIEELSDELEQIKQIRDEKVKCLEEARDKIYELELKLKPVEKLEELEKELREKEDKLLLREYRFQLESKYLLRENARLSEILSALLSRKEISERVVTEWGRQSHCDRDGQYYVSDHPSSTTVRDEITVKPLISGATLEVEDEEKGS